MSAEARIRCEGGACSHHAREHYALWPVIGRGSLVDGRRSGARRFSAGGCVALRVGAPPPYFYSSRKSATRVHRTAAMATVWARGAFVLLGARGLCGTRQCSSVASKTLDVDGLSPCPRCEEVAAASGASS